MTNLSSIMGEIGSAGSALNEFISDNKTAVIATGTGLAGVALGAGAVSVVNRVRNKTTRKKSKRKSGSRSSRKKNTKSKKKRTYNYARTAGKSRDRSSKRIRMTKKGQPYIILKSGKARFIKKSSARNSRKRKGGRY